MALVRGSNPVWYLVDLNADGFNDNFYMWVLENEIPYTPANVYSDENGTLRSNPVQFESNGTLPIDVYFDENVTYRLEFRENNGVNPPSQSDPLIYLIENYNPLGVDGGAGEADSVLVTNQITSPQFADISFTSPLTLTSVTDPDPIEIAPGWELVLAGTGSITLTQTALTSATITPTNAPYALRLNISGSFTGVTLRQRLNTNGVLWSEKYVSASITARIEGGTQPISTRLDDSMGSPLAVFISDNLSNVFEEYKATAQLPATTNTDTPPNAYLDYKIILPTTGDVYLTSVQLVPVASDVEIPYSQDSVNRQIDHTFNVYRSKLSEKPIPSWLIGWDFPNNPAQWGESYGAFAAGINKSNYVWDQTMVFQSIDSGFSADRAASGAFEITIAQANTQVAMIQYIEQKDAREILNDKISVYVSSKKTTGSATNATVSLWYTSAALPDIKSPNYNSIVATLSANGGVATQNGTWTEVPRKNNNEPAVFSVAPSSNTNFNEATFDGWDMAGIADVHTTTNLAIVIGFQAMALNDVVEIQAVGLYSGDIATRPAPKTKSEELLDCQRYYYKSFASGTAPAQGVGAAYLQWQTFVTAGSNEYDLRWPVPMFKTPVITSYNPVSANNQVRDFVAGADVGAPGNTISDVNIFIDANNPGGTVGNILGVHITADARIGT